VEIPTVQTPTYKHKKQQMAIVAGFKLDKKIKNKNT